VLKRSESVALLGANGSHILADKIYQWLSPPDTSRNYNELLARRQVNTCTWFINEMRFAEWKSKGDRFLWIYGLREFLDIQAKFRAATKDYPAGSGKSVLWCAS
jgi:hypothetical protein